MVTMAQVRWQPIEDLPQDWQNLASSELKALAEVWQTQATRLRDSDAVKQFNERLSREWAIETGIIENLYSIDRGTTQLLIEKGIEASLIAYGTTDKPAEKIVPILKAQQIALEGLFAFVKQERDLSVSYVKQLHQAITSQQDSVQAYSETTGWMEVQLIRGDWKKLPNNPTRPNGQVHYYAPPEQVASEMDSLIALHQEHLRQGVPPEVEAAWLHHRFTQIHPFQDGNGRVARSLATLIFLRAGWFPLVVTRDDRADYIDALEKADDGDLLLLVALFVKIQKKAFVRALSLSEDVITDYKSLQEVISAIGENLKTKKSPELEKIQKEAVTLSEYLEDLAKKEIISVVEALNKQFQSSDQPFVAQMSKSTELDHWAGPILFQVEQQARNLGYYANLQVRSTLVGLQVANEQKILAHLVVCFHGLGFEFTGIMAVSAFSFYVSSDIERMLFPPVFKFLSDEVFEYSYNESKRELLKRFQQWLNTVLIRGLSRWKQEIF